MIRLANKDDAEELLNIYKEYIDTPITFELELPSVIEFQNRISNILEFYPYIVIEEDNKILGYAYAHRYHERMAYSYDVELSIYLRSDSLGKGIGKVLYNKLFILLKEMGIRNMYSCITTPNLNSEGIHKALGFTYIGKFTNAGFKNGKWHSVVWYEKAINDYDIPNKLKSIHEIDIEKILGV